MSRFLSIARKWPLLVGHRRGYRVLDRLMRLTSGKSMRGMQWITHNGIETQYDCDNYHERLMAYELQGEEGFAFLPMLLREGDTFLDAGTNAGMHSAAAVGIVGPSGRVFSIEANPHLVARLKQAAERNRTPHWTIIDRALSDTEGASIEFHLSEFPSWSSMAPLAEEDKPRETIQVPTTTLDALAPTLGKVRAMKIDIEGAETLAFRGGAHFLSSANSPDFIIAECNDRMLQRTGSSAKEMVEILRSHGYTPHEMFWQTRRRPAARPQERIPESNAHLDLLFAHERVMKEQAPRTLWRHTP